MSGEFSDAGSIKALDAVTGRATQTAASTYLALWTSATVPNDTTAGTEYTATGYARVAVTWGNADGTATTAPSLNASNVPQTANNNTITFGPFTAGTGATITYAALYSASTGGSVLAWWTLDTARTPSTNDSLQFTQGNLKLSVD